MKKTRILSAIIAMIMVFSCIPFVAFAYSNITLATFSDELTLNSVYEGQIDSDSIYITDGGWSGYAQGFTANLTPGYYYITAKVSGENAVYVDRAISVMTEEHIGGDPYYENIANAYNIAEESNTVTVTVKFAIETEDTYYILLWGFCEDIDPNPLFDDETKIIIEVGEATPPKTIEDLEFNNLALDTPFSDTINEDDPYVETNAWNGYLKGFQINLAPGSYLITTTVSAEDAVYIDRAISVVKASDYNYDIVNPAIAFNSHNDINTTLTVKLIFEVTEAGLYDIFVWGYCDAQIDEIFGEGTDVTVVITDNFTTESIYGISETIDLEVGEKYEGIIDENDTYIVSDPYNGYLKVFSIELEEGFYNITTEASAIGSNYINRCISVIPKNGLVSLDPMESNPIYSYVDSNYNETGDTVDLYLSSSFIVPESGEYYVFVWGTAEYDGELIFGEDTYCSVLIDKSNPIEINVNTAEDLKQFNEDIYFGNYDSVPLFVLNIVNNIDMNGVEWENNFYGDIIVVNGNNKTINNLNGTLLGNIDKIYVNDLTLKADVNVGSSDEDNIDVSGFGLLGGSIKEAYINNCHIDANVNVYGGGSEIGLFLGYCADYFIFEDCTLNGSLNLSYGSYVGGFIGCSYCDMTKTYFKNCQADISISIDSDDYYIGGFVGYIEDKAVFENCQTIVDINMPKGCIVGGFAGIIDEDQVFINCSAKGKIIASEFIGGMVGVSECCGYNSFVNCVSIVDVSGIDIMGGFIGTMYDGEYFANCYSAGEINYLGTVELDQLLENEVYIGSFYGGMYYYGENHFINCFTAKNEYLGAGSKPEYEEDFIFIDFSDDNQVNNLADKLNEYAGNNEELVIWKGRNEKNGPELFFGIVGDINGDKTVDMFDYVTVKSICFSNEYNEEEYFLADVNADGNVDMFDYLQVKSIYFNK